MQKKKGIIEYLVDWEHIPFAHRVVSIPLVPTIFLLSVALIPLLAILEVLQYLYTGKTPTIYKDYADYIVGDC